ncbi:thiamine phosphate synthase [Rhodovulum sulfidophilum]|uniref:Thiamine phosphate synthase n=1 Tax=Rhodovulum sulfidophilum TaxID=35806 RepID=A0ABS1RPC0_RHOSU|nr:thiamine phosphate synthase [Rhodovulum sulfidophilum]ANB34442.1 thiamine phosphate synthase [Rhodovulum sulfidophilum DSM 1374]ANB38265.1 thiamine phosphate synthase [Rhodovulum sulfidophilum]MBL3553402.1 thiamine phosphate synthase [Rhodovulum sulfidophilum]MBL3584323.1 thiamine phosphate synthase [Rhodovulum sulfidophilum]MBL3607896.1 thiamine phosphate synthase [Rhodovulum sulfidophilum]
MAEPERPQIYLITPPAFDPDSFAPRLAAVLDAHEIACLRLSMASHDEDLVARAADALREIAHARDIPLVVEAHVGLVERLGLDGVHLTDGQRSVRKVRKLLGADAIVGAFCGALRHDGIGAAEAGADYIAFGPAGESGLGDGSRAEADLFGWWSEMIEIPVVAEGALDATTVAALSPLTDFFALGEEIWREEDPVSALGALIAAMG